MTAPHFHKSLLPCYRRELRDRWVCCKIKAVWAQSLQRNVVTWCPRCSLQHNQDQSPAPQLKKTHYPAPGEEMTVPPTLTFLPLTLLPFLQLSKKSLLPCSHVWNVKTNETIIYYIFILLTAGQTRTAGCSFMLGSWRMMWGQKSVSHLTIVPEYLKPLLNGRLQKVESSRDAPEQEHCSHLPRSF